MISNLHKGDIYNYKIYAQRIKSKQQVDTNACPYKKMMELMEFFKIKFSKRASLYDGKPCLTRKMNIQSVLSLFFHFKNKHM